ncbi:hypothetical protein N7522_002984 [Penicillium canescens]|nr:hypothetical protein N7522_002984 [Penicillium canescens]
MEQPRRDRAILDSDEIKVAQWYQEAKEGTEGFLISTATWNWCLAELRDKAEIWQTTGHVLVFDSSSAVYQANLSMTLSPEEFQKEVIRLGSQQSHEFPLVNPSLFPLVEEEHKIFDLYADGSPGLWRVMPMKSGRSDVTPPPLASTPEPPRWKQADSSKHEILLEDITPEKWDCPRDVRRDINSKRKRRIWFDHPEPGALFSYEQWQQGQFTGRAINPQRFGKCPDPLHHDHIPVVVEITGIELTPENPVYPGDTHFHNERLRDDHIVATSLYLVESKNVTQARVAFGHEDKFHAGELERDVKSRVRSRLS